MPTVSSIKDEVSKNKVDIAKGVLLGIIGAFGVVKFAKWTKKEMFGEEEDE